MGLALKDLSHAADLFRSIYDQTDGEEGGCHWRRRLGWLMTWTTRLLRSRTCTPRRSVPTSSSRSPAPGKACPPSMGQSLRACRSSYTPVFLRALPGDGLCVFAGGRAAHRGRAQTQCRLRASLSVSCWDVADRNIGGDRLQERYPHAGPVILGRRRAHVQRRR